jgi:prepilin-type N-terminal cleavage/methylation domain-containing protein/prepilin-type processing-associated H-X9-DG protein
MRVAEREMNGMTRKGFTLIELLVVIAIIAILAAILFPVFARAREKARQSSCLSNIKQVNLAILQYAQDYDEFLPHYRNFRIGRYWYHIIEPYLKNSQVLRCPSHANKPVGYAWNIDYIGYGSSTHIRLPPTRLSDIDYPANTLILCDNAYNAGMYRPDRWISNWSTSGSLYEAYLPWVQVHNGGGNVAFLDGHAKWMKVDEILWNNDLWNPAR